MLSRNLFTVVLVPMMFVLAMANLLPIDTKVITETNKTGNGTEVDGTVVAGIGSDPGQLVVKPPAGFALPTDNITSINGTGVDIVGPAHDNITTALNANESAIVDHQSEEVFTDPSHDQKNDNLNNISKEKELLQPKQLPEADPPVNNCGNGCCVMAYVGTVLLVLNVSVLLGFLLYRGAAYCREEQLHREEQRQRRHRATHPQI